MDARIDTKAVTGVDALPTTVVSDQALFLKTSGQHFVGYVLNAVDSVRFTMTAGANLDWQGFDRATGLGSLQGDVPFIDRLIHNDNTQKVEIGNQV